MSLREQLSPLRLGQLLEASCCRPISAGWALNHAASLGFRQYREMKRRYELSRAGMVCDRHIISDSICRHDSDLHMLVQITQQLWPHELV